MEERPSEPVPGRPVGPTRTVVRRRPGTGPRSETPTPSPTDEAPAGPRRRVHRAAPADDGIERARTGLPLRPIRTGRGPVTGAVAPYVGVLAVAVVILLIAVVGLLIAVLGSRQPHVLESTDPAVVDSFGRADGSALGDVEAGGEWEEVGRWEVVGGAAFLAEQPEGGGRGFALLPESSNRARVAATFAGLADDGGLVARYQGPGDHVALLPVTGLGTWRLDVVVGGQVVATDNVGLVDVTEGTRAELVVRDDTAWVIIDGQVRGELDIADGPSRGRVGLEAGLGTGGSTRFDDVAHEWR